MRELKEIAEDLVRTGLNQKQGRLLEELLEAATPDADPGTAAAVRQQVEREMNAQPEGDDVEEGTTD